MITVALLRVAIWMPVFSRLNGLNEVLFLFVCDVLCDQSGGPSKSPNSKVN